MARRRTSRRCSSWTWFGGGVRSYASRRWRRGEGSRHITQVDIFGEEKLEDMSDEEQPVQREQPSTLSRFEPQLLKEYYVSQDDENIRRRDIPERLQCRQLPTVRR